jgi:hypothetical protein
MSLKQNDVFTETLKEKIDNEFIQEVPNYESITSWRTELVELGYHPEITPDEEKKFWGEVLTPTKEDEEFEFPLQDEPDDESRPEEDIDANARQRGGER